MDPTTTEHDYRFPRRPDHSQPATNHARTHDASNDSSPGAAPGGAPASAVKPARALDLEQSFARHDDLLGAALFPTLRDGDAAAGPSLDKMQSEDPLAAQVWKFFTKTKQQLPNQQRMENLTWRMMALSMRKKREEEERESREGYVAPTHHLVTLVTFVL